MSFSSLLREYGLRFALLLYFSQFLIGPVVAQEKTVELVPQVGHGVLSAVFSPDGRTILSGGSDKTAKLWDVATGRLLRTFAGTEEVYGAAWLAFSPDGRTIVSRSSHSTLKLWDVATGKLVRTFETDLPFLTCVAFSPDGLGVLVGGTLETGGGIELRDAETGNLIRKFQGHSQSVNSVAFSSDGRRILSSSDDKTVKLWDVGTGTSSRTFVGHSDRVTSARFSPNGRTLVSGSDNMVKVWDLATGRVLRTFKEPPGYSVAFAPDGRTILSGTLRLWNAATGRMLRTLNSGVVSSSAAFAADGRFILSVGNKLSLLDVTTGNVLRTFDHPFEGIRSLRFAPDGKVLLTGGYKTLKLWDVATGRLLRILDPRNDAIYSVAYSADGHTLLSGTLSANYGDNNIKLWDVATGKLIGGIGTHYGLRSAAFAPDGRTVLSSGFNGTLKLWDVATGALLRNFEKHSGSVTSVAFAPDGRTVLSGSEDKTLKLWDAVTGKLLRKFEGHYGSITSVAFAPDGRTLLSASFEETIVKDDTIKLWDVTSGQLVRPFRGHSGSINCVAFSPDGRTILSGGDDKTIKLWDVATGRLLRTFEGHSSPVWSVAFSPDGSRIASGAGDSTIKLWKTDTGSELASLVASNDSQWLAVSPSGFFNASSPRVAPLLAIVRGLDAYSVDQMWQSLYAPDLVREKLADDPNREVAKASEVINLEKVLDSGKAPQVAITSPASGADSSAEIVTAEATITAQETSGIGRVEWRVNGITVGVSDPASNSGPTLTVKQTLALDPGENIIEAVAYNGRNLLASVPAQTTVTWTGTVTTKPKLHVLAIGINKYIDKGGGAPGETEAKFFPPLGLAVPDAKALAEEFKKAGQGLYEGVYVRTVLDEEATPANLEAIVTEMAAQIEPRDTFVLYAATHGYSYQGRFYLIPQDYEGGPDPQALAARAIDQLKLQDWIANRIRAKRALILLDSCESGALTSGYSRSRFEGPESDAAIGRLHEATGRPVLTAAGLGQSALELTELGHGVFTSALIDSFYRGDANNDGMVSLTELVSHVQDLVPRLIKDPKARAEVIRRGSIGGVQSARFGSRGEDFALVHRLQ